MCLADYSGQIRQSAGTPQEVHMTHDDRIRPSFDHRGNWAGFHMERWNSHTAAYEPVGTAKPTYSKLITQPYAGQLRESLRLANLEFGELA